MGIHGGQAAAGLPIDGCITCQHFTYGTDAHCRTLLGCKLQSKQLSQGEHLTKKCRHWLTRRERQVGWCPEAA